MSSRTSSSSGSFLSLALSSRPHRPLTFVSIAFPSSFPLRPSKIDVSFVDYDSVRFHVSTPQSKTEIWLSMGVKCWADVVRYGAMDIIQREYGTWLSDEVEEGYDVTLKFDVEKVPELGGECCSLGEKA